MPTTIAQIEALARKRLVEDTPVFWSSEELTDIIILGIKDLWRDIVDVKAEHFLTINETDVYVGVNNPVLQGVPADVHKVYLIEPIPESNDFSRSQIKFTPKEYNHPSFQGARTKESTSEPFGEILYAVMGAGAPVGAPEIRIAPKLNARVNLSFAYVPTLEAMVNGSYVPIPGEADNALIAWTVAYARAKERSDRSPDPSWIGVYVAEKKTLIHTLDQRQFQEPLITDGTFDALWT